VSGRNERKASGRIWQNRPAGARTPLDDRSWGEQAVQCRRRKHTGFALHAGGKDVARVGAAAVRDWNDEGRLLAGSASATQDPQR
jgi:hypothetical protein